MHIRRAHIPWILATLVILLLPRQILALEPGQAAYMGGTSAVHRGTIGDLDMTSPGDLIFRPAAPGSAPSEIDIPYKNIRCFEYHAEVAHHIGVLPAIAVALVRRRERQHFFTITYSDASQTAQVAIFEVPKRDPPAIIAILRSRASQNCSSDRAQTAKYTRGNNVVTPHQ
jgi:hypothetical protein